MADGSHIEWTDATWQPITGCSVVSPGCTNCYAMRLAGTRLRHHWSRQGLTQDSKAGPVWTGEVRINERWLEQPLRWRRPRRIFTCAHGDLFHEAVPDEWIDRVFAVMQRASRHTFQILTKRAKRMRDYTNALYPEADSEKWFARGFVSPLGSRRHASQSFRNVWLGVSVEDQARADERIPELLATPAAVRFISAEPLLGPIDISPWIDPAIEHPLIDDPRIVWVIVGGESGPGARPMHPDWARSLRDQCQAAGVAYFFKQHGEWIDADARRAHGFYERLDHPMTWSEAGALAREQGVPCEHQSDGSTLMRVGKRAAGRQLDGREWSEFPTDA